MSKAIAFILNGAPVTVEGVAPTTTLLNWLRYRRGLTGTKEGCAEGDCGACTVAVRTLEPDGALTTRAMNACLLLLPMVHGKDVVTVEGVASDEGTLHPVQLKMADGHGSQCGFCTPGFVMAMWAACQAEPRPDAGEVNDLIAGNLCRCTGYGPIIDALAGALAEPGPAWDAAREDVAASRLGEGALGEALDYTGEGGRFLAPLALDGTDGFADAVADHPDARILSGATDVGLWVTKKGFEADLWIYTGRVAELAVMREEDGALWVGAGVTLDAFRERIAGVYPDLGELLRRFAGPQIRAAGTVGGNIANGSPIGDLPPALIAADAALVLRHRDARRTLPLEHYFIDYGKQDRRPGEFVEAVRLPLPADASSGERLGCYKLSKRFDSDISAVCGCFNVAVEGGVVTAARIAFGGMAATPRRAQRAEAALVGVPWTEATARRAAEALREDFAPISDLRATAGYRIRAAGQLLMKYFLEQSGSGVATRIVGRRAAANEAA